MPGGGHGLLHVKADTRGGVAANHGRAHPEKGADRSERPPAAPPVAADVDAALAMVEGDAALLADLAKLFCDESHKMLASIEEGIRTRNAGALERAAHSLKGSLGTFAAPQAVNLALKLERLGRAKELNDAESVFAALSAELKSVCMILERLPVMSPQN